jgi:hypothetical protein
VGRRRSATTVRKRGKRALVFPRANASHEWVSGSFPPAKLHICISVGQEGEFRDPLSFLLHITPISESDLLFFSIQNDIPVYLGIFSGRARLGRAKTKPKTENGYPGSARHSGLKMSA